MESSTPILLVMAGPNGSGKSTITGRLQPIGQYVNADEIQRFLGCDSMEAAKNAEETREALLKKRESFTFETVLSTPRNLDLMRRAKEAGYTVICVYVLTCSYEINVERVRRRVENGGHDVPTEKIIARYGRAMKLIPELLRICDQLLIYDNSCDRRDGSPERIVTLRDGELRIHPTKLWKEENIRRLLTGSCTGEKN